MDVTLVVKKILDVMTFTSKRDGSEIKKFGFVGETKEEYPKTIAITVLGQDKWDKMQIQVGGEYQVSIEVSSREYQGRWYTEASSWFAKRIDNNNGGSRQANTSSQESKPAPPQPTNDGEQDGNDEVPF